jgi:biotin synthase
MNTVTEASVLSCNCSKSVVSLHEIAALFAEPFSDLLLQAHTIHRERFAPNEVQLSTLLNIKSGGCPEDCAYCPQSAHHQTEVSPTGLLDVVAIVDAANSARQSGATRFCMGAAWRQLKDRDLDQLVSIVSAVHETGMETCLTVGMLTRTQAECLKTAGLDYYNHNIDTSEGYYEKIVSTRGFRDRITTLSNVRHAGLKVCSGGIIGMGEALSDRIAFLQTLASLPRPPESVPINMLVPVAGTPLSDQPLIDALELAQMIAITRIVLRSSYIRLSAGRSRLTDAEQALCFFAGANSIFYGEELLTTPNNSSDSDRRLFSRLGISPAKRPS